LQRVGIGLAGLEAVAGGDAVAVADQTGRSAAGAADEDARRISRQIETISERRTSTE
jgi:hypothetical protein